MKELISQEDESVTTALEFVFFPRVGRRSGWWPSSGMEKFSWSCQMIPNTPLKRWGPERFSYQTCVYDGFRVHILVFSVLQADDVRRVADSELGFQQVTLSRPAQAKTYLFVNTERMVVGCLIAEPIRQVCSSFDSRLLSVGAFLRYLQTETAS